MINTVIIADRCLDGGYLYSLIVQFFLLLIPMLYLSKRYYTAVLAVTVSTFVASIIYIFYEISTTELSPTLMLTANAMSSEIYKAYADLLYIKPWARAPAFLIGKLLQFLEWRIFSPFARNIFVVFLISEPVSLYLFSSLHRPLHATVWSLVNIAIGTIILSNFVAFLLDILITMPVQNVIFEMLSGKKFDTLIHIGGVHSSLISGTEKYDR
ncbi:unnamed protein product [Litomosoides sigmodontis]|uniref:Uncharacterized protein n=1 Tax=Litomosoides sigmodontis TaxID=42156 RepID=A0A3P7JUG9_LITSI|nr:unnamed protein product [Litomosoides sigmodontis]